MKKQFLTILLIVGFSTPVLAQEEELPDGSVSVDFAWVSNYVFRGNDLFTNAAVQRGERIGEHTGAPAFQPSITFGGPEGMYFNIWGSYALTHRADVDSDGVLQVSPGGDDILASDANGYSTTTTWGGYNYRKSIELPTPEQGSEIVRGYVNNLVASGLGATNTNGVETLLAAGESGGAKTVSNAAGTVTGGLPGFYKEQNGLERLDETDFTFGYGVDTDVGTMDFGVVTYIHPGVQKAAWGNFLEFFVSFSPYAAPALSLTTYADEESNEIYSSLAFAPEIELAEGTSLGFNVAANHKSREGMSGISHYDVGVSFSTGGLSIGVNGAYRENFYLVGADFDGSVRDDNGLFALTGNSTSTDGLVADPSKNNSWFHSYSNTITGLIIQEGLNKSKGNGATATNAIAYNYTARQKLPRWVYYTSIAYTVEL